MHGVRRNSILLTGGLALVAALLFGVSTASQAQQDPGECDVAFVEPGPSPVIANGTRVGVTVACDIKPQTVAVELDVRAGDQLVLSEQDRARVGGLNAKLQKTVDVAVPPVSVGACVEVLGERHCL